MGGGDGGRSGFRAVLSSTKTIHAGYSIGLSCMEYGMPAGYRTVFLSDLLGKPGVSYICTC